MESYCGDFFFFNGFSVVELPPMTPESQTYRVQAWDFSDIDIPDITDRKIFETFFILTPKCCF